MELGKFDIQNQGLPTPITNSSLNYSENFGFQWQRFSETQLDSFTQTDISESRLKRVLGPIWSRLPGLRVLEVGCGAGRFTEILLREGAIVTSVDMSDAIKVNAALPAEPGQHRVFRADINELPFPEGEFDLVLALGVLQHTPSPEKSIVDLWRQVTPQGWLVLDHYTWTRSYISLRLLYRQILKRLRPETAFRILESLAPVFLPLHQLVRNSPLGRLILNRFSPFVTYYDVFPQLSLGLQREWALLDSFDQLADRYKHFRSLRQIRACLRTLGGQMERCAYGGNGVEARIRREDF